MNKNPEATKDELTFSLERTQDELDNLRRYIEEFSSFLPLAVCVVSPIGEILDINQALKDLTGYTENDLLTKHFSTLFRNTKKAESFFHRILSEKTPQHLEMEVKTKKERNISVLCSGSLRKDRAETIIGGFIAIADITENKKLQKNLEEKVRERTKELEHAKNRLEEMLQETKLAKLDIEKERNKTRAVLQSLLEGLIVLGKDQNIAFVNPAAEEILDLKEDEVVGKRLADIQNAPYVKKLLSALGDRIQISDKRYELAIDRPLRHYYYVFVSPAIVRGKVIGSMIVLHDITRDKEIDRMKSEFLSLAAHQLRTPLTAIKWTFNMILNNRKNPFSKEINEMLHIGQQSNERMILLIQDLLNVARIEEGRFLYNPDYYQIEYIAINVMKMMKGIARRKNIKIIYKEPEQKLPKVKIDASKISLVFQNLLDNAIKYSKQEQQVQLELYKKENSIFCAVKDTGCGIPKSQQKRIFEKFFRAKNAAKREPDGNGLGLFICQNIIKAHKGTIGFSSSEGNGSTFWFTLPINSAKF